MSKIIYDKYNLGQSQSKVINDVAQEISIDLCLEPNTYDLTFGKVYGQVVNYNNTPIKNALIELMTTKYVPVMHVITDENGEYSIDNIQPGSYNIFATASGYETKEGTEFTISKFQKIEINFVLDGESEMALGVIAGDLLDITTNNGIEGAVISLFTGTDVTSSSLVAISYTNEYGQFTFRKLQKGDYVVQAKALGYNSITVNTSISIDGQIIPMKLMALINNIYQGTVSGIITDENNYPIARADVILYRVKSSLVNIIKANITKSNNTQPINFSQKNLIPIAFTKTTERGIYLFAHVPMGAYIVKSNELEITTVKID